MFLTHINNRSRYRKKFFFPLFLISTFFLSRFSSFSGKLKILSPTHSVALISFAPFAIPCLPKDSSTLLTILYTKSILSRWFWFFFLRFSSCFSLKIYFILFYFMLLLFFRWFTHQTRTRSSYMCLCFGADVVVVVV